MRPITKATRDKYKQKVRPAQTCSDIKQEIITVI